MERDTNAAPNMGKTQDTAAGPWGARPSAPTEQDATARFAAGVEALDAQLDAEKAAAKDRTAYDMSDMLRDDWVKPDEERSIEPAQDRTQTRKDTSQDKSDKPSEDEKPKPDARADAGRSTAGPEVAAPASANAKRDISVEAGDVPEAVRKKYLLQTNRLNKGEVAFHTDAKSTTPAFKDNGGKLTTVQTNESVIRDMVATAEHRGWSEIKVKGDEDFRRAVWLEASQKGIEVSGYRPSERDLQQLEKLLDGRGVQSIEPVTERVRGDGEQQAPERAQDARGTPADRPERPDYDAGVTGVLVGQGTAPYQHKAGNEEQAFIKLETAPGQVHEVWGVGLPDALERAGATIGETITVKRDGVEQVEKPIKVTDKATGQQITETRTVDRNKWEVVADRFRTGSPAELARDPELKGAQSTMRAVETMLATVPDKGLRERLMEAAKEHVAAKLEGGNKFKEHRVREQRIKDPTPVNRRKEQRVQATGRAVVARKDQSRVKGEEKARAKDTSQAQPANARDGGKIKKNPERSRSR